MSYPERRVPARIRIQVLLRDGGTCKDCGFKSVDGAGMHVHHIKERANGGTDEPDNLTTLCEACHRKRHVVIPASKEKKIRSVRLDDDVWEAVKEMDCSLNQYLRTVLLDGAGPAPGLVADDSFQRGVEHGKVLRDRYEAARRKLLADPDGLHDLIPPRPSGLQGTITVDAEEKSATVNIVSETPPDASRLPVESWKRGPRQKGDKSR